MKKKRKMISLKGWMHYLFFVMRRHKRISLLGYIIYNTYYIGRPQALMRGLTSPQSINEKTTTCDRVDMENNNGLSYSEYIMRIGANENITLLMQSGTKCVIVASAMRAEQGPCEPIKGCISEIKEQ